MKIKNKLVFMSKTMLNNQDYKGASVLLEAVDLIERLEYTLDRAEHRRKANAFQVRKLVSKLRGANKGLRTLANKLGRPAIKQSRGISHSPTQGEIRESKSAETKLMANRQLLADMGCI